jgi:RNA polymerase sigma-70 factor (ECF subfamily)
MGTEHHTDKMVRDEAFVKEFMPLMKQLYNFALKLTLDEDEASDLVQESYLKAYRFFDSYAEGTNAKAWMFRIMKNTFINDFRKKTREPNKVDYDELESFYNSEEAEHKVKSDLRIDMMQDKLGDEVTVALNALPVDFRTAIILCDIESFTYEEMSKILDIPIGTVRSRLHRARQVLKDKLTNYAKSQGFDTNSQDLHPDEL